MTKEEIQGIIHFLMASILYKEMFQVWKQCVRKSLMGWSDHAPAVPISLVRSISSAPAITWAQRQLVFRPSLARALNVQLNVTRVRGYRKEKTKRSIESRSDCSIPVTILRSSVLFFFFSQLNSPSLIRWLLINEASEKKVTEELSSSEFCDQSSVYLVSKPRVLFPHYGLDVFDTCPEKLFSYSHSIMLAHENFLESVAWYERTTRDHFRS